MLKKSDPDFTSHFSAAFNMSGTKSINAEKTQNGANHHYVNTVSEKMML